VLITTSSEVVGVYLNQTLASKTIPSPSVVQPSTATLVSSAEASRGGCHEATAATAEAGVTYYILAYDNQEDGSGNGGMLNLIVETTVLPQSDLRIESAELDPQNRTITLSGTFTCEQDSTFRLEAIVRQSKSKVTAESEPLMYTAVCNGGIDEQEWQVSGKASSGFFRPGAATVSITWTTCRISYCTFSGTDAPIRIAVG
jgi:hypothetical protein